MIVVDASAAVLALLNDGEARRALAAEAACVPHLADAEVAHTLRAHVRRGQIRADEGRTALVTWARLGIDRWGVAGLLPRVWELRDNLTAYDAIYVALAEALGSDLVTADARLVRAAGPRCTIAVVRR